MAHTNAGEPKVVTAPGGIQQGLSKFKILVTCKVEEKKVMKTPKEIEEEKAAGTFVGVVKTTRLEVCDPQSFCEVDNWGSMLTFGTKEVEIKKAKAPTVKAKYYLEKNSIFAQPTETSQLEYAIRSWDEKLNVTEFVIDGKRFIPGLCPKAIQDKMEIELFQKEAQEKEKIEKEKNEILKLANEINEREKLAKYTQDKEKELSEKLEKVRLDLLQIQNEKKQVEIKKQQDLENSKANSEKLEKEKMQKMKVKEKSF